MRIRKKHLVGAVLLFVMLCIFSRILYRTAWICDDAYITFRTVDNFTHGNGMRWNVSERVQSFTHPLWFFLLSFFSKFSGELYYTSLFLSIAFTLIVLTVFSIAAHDNIYALGPLLAVLLFSRAFIDYSTSGLENPLSHALLLVFLLLYWHAGKRYLLLFFASLAAALGILTRPDLALFFFPCLLHGWYVYRDKRAIIAIVSGFIPLFAWMAFSLLYYGFLFPNTAYAKLGSGIPAGELCMQGLHYLQNSLTRDPLTLTTIVFAAGAPFVFRKPQLIPVAAGILLYLLYIVRIGGDFMSGRFLTFPLIFSVALLFRMPFQIGPKLSVGLMIFVAALGMATDQPTLLSGPQYGKDLSKVLDPFLIADERAFYYRKTGLAAANSSRPDETGYTIAKQHGIPREDSLQVVERDTTGMSGFMAGPAVHIIDLYALNDPLLARLPAIYAPKWRIGHFWRHVPEGYKESLETGKNVIKEPGLAAYYDHLALVTRAPLLSLKRWKTILNFQIGAYDHLINQEACRFPNLRRISVTTLENNRGGESLASPVDADKAGVEFAWDRLRHDTSIFLDVAGDSYYLLFMDNSEIVGLLPRMPASILDARGIEPGTIQLEIPAKTSAKGFNAVRIMPLGSSNPLQIRQISLGDRNVPAAHSSSQPQQE